MRAAFIYREIEEWAESQEPIPSLLGDVTTLLGWDHPVFVDRLSGYLSKVISHHGFVHG
jgi:hypothetical protein